MTTDTPRTPWVTLLFVLACLGAEFAALAAPDLRTTFALDGRAFQPMQLLTYGFLHANVIHLLGNMIFLAAVGPFVESNQGPGRFAIVLLLGTVAGGLLHLLLARQVPLIGFSGAVAACVAFAGVRFFRRPVPLAPRFTVPVGAVIVIWTLLQLEGALFNLRGEAGATSFWAHLGGIMAGLALSMAFGVVKEVESERNADTLRKMDARGPAARLAVIDSMLAQDPQNAKTWLDKAETERSLGNTAAETDALIAALPLAKGTDCQSLVRRLIELSAMGRLSAIDRLQLADQFRTDARDLSISLLKSVVDVRPHSDRRAEALMSLVELDATHSADYLSALERDYPIDPMTDLARAKGLLP